MKYKLHLQLLVIIEALTSYIYGANILAFLPVPAKSHMHIFKPLLEELVKRNHTITAVVSLAQPISAANYKEIVIQSNTLSALRNHNFFPENEEVQTFEKTKVLDFGYTICQDGFKNLEFQKLVQSSKDKPFDLIINEILFYQFSVAALGYIFKAPMISLNSHGLTNLDEEFSGNPTYLPYEPDLSLPYGNKMTFQQRFHNTLNKLQTNMYNYFYNLPKHEQLLKKYFPKHHNDLPPLKEMLISISLHLINTHPCINPRPYTPKIIQVGGIHIPSNKQEKLPQDLQKFLDEATEGVIYFSFGTNIPANKMPKHKTQAFIETFSNIKQKVLWKVTLDDTSGIPKNVLIKSWVPQSSVLAHKNCLLFITHGGLLSIEEAIWYGVPVLGIPFFGDQQMNIERVDQAGIGIKIEYKNITAKSLSWAINELLNTPSYRRTVKNYSEVFRDYLHSPLDKAVYWTEYVIRHKGTPYFTHVGNYMPWYQYHLFDIYLCVIIILSFLFTAMYILLKFVFKFIINCIKLKSISNSNKYKTN